MRNEIRSHLDNPGYLEKMYRSNKTHFTQEFNAIYPELSDNVLAEFWHERLAYESEENHWGTRAELRFVLIASLLAGIIAKLPDLFNMEAGSFYARNIGFIAFPMLMAYFAWKNKLSFLKCGYISAITIGCLMYINLLPADDSSDTLVLACIHMILLLWSVVGFSFIGELRNREQKRLAFLKYMGDAAVITTLILIAGGILSGITVGLFSLAGIHIEIFYAENVAVFGLAAAPIIGTYLTQVNPKLVGKVSPVIARIFSPLVLVMLVLYLIALPYSSNDPYGDRDFLLIFNALLIGVMALIFFSVAEASESTSNRFVTRILFLLSAVTIVVNGIALSAILYRISEWGITPNRAAVLGSNILVLVHLLLVTHKIFRATFNHGTLSDVGKPLAVYLPAYFIWAAFVTFVFSLIFGFE